MAKDPAVLWYWSDWNSGTLLMSRFLKGCYIDLLHAQFHNGPLSLDEVKTCLGQDFENSWPQLKKKFKEENSLFFNERLEFEKSKRKNFVDSRKENIKKRYSSVATSVEDMNVLSENENINEIENEIKEKGVQGEKDLTPLEIGNTIEYVDRVKQYKLSELEVLNFWEAFKINEAEPSYASHGKKIKHFRDWLKNRDHGNKSNLQGNKSYRSRQNGAVADLISELGNTIAGATKNTSA